MMSKDEGSSKYKCTHTRSKGPNTMSSGIWVSNRDVGEEPDLFKRFFLAPPVGAAEADKVCPSVAENFQEALLQIERAPMNHTARNIAEDDLDPEDMELDGELSDKYLSEEDARSYQLSMVQAAKEKNAIIHLGTGAGKTLIAIMLIRHFLELPVGTSKDRRQVVFLVPSVALCRQQYAVLKANLSCSIMSVSGNDSNVGFNENIEKSLSQSTRVVVATHGAYLELLSHHKDIFKLSEVDLLILDECHHCMGNTPYGQIMKGYYHKSSPLSRARVLGLTASPLIHVKPSWTSNQIMDELKKLEELMDSEIVSLPMTTTSKKCEDMLVPYARAIQKHHHLPNPDDYQLHKDRRKELNQICQLHRDLGAIVTRRYCSEYLDSLVRDKFGGESDAEFSRARIFVGTLLEKIGSPENGQGITPKVAALADLLTRELKGSNSVGVVFTERRITAVALYHFFRQEIETRPSVSDKLDLAINPNEGAFDDADEDHQEQPSPQHINGQFDDADEGSVGNIDETCHSDTGGSLFPVVTDLNPGSPAIQPGFEVTPGTKRIRPCVMVRKRDSLLLAANQGKVLSAADFDVLEQEKRRRDNQTDLILRDLKSGNSNLLFATSVVEEGIDLPSCSFVACIDGIKTLKAYIQMKGRARQQKASFYFMHDTSKGEEEAAKLKQFAKTESLVNECLAKFQTTKEEMDTAKETKTLVDLPEEITLDLNESLCVSTITPDHPLEHEAAKAGYFEAPKGKVTAKSARSLIARYSMQQWIENGSSSSKSSLEAYLPLYDDKVPGLVLPGSLKDKVIKLPKILASKPRGEQLDLLNLMACVRLYDHNLLNDQLLPMKPGDVREKLHEFFVGNLPKRESLTSQPRLVSGREVFVYRFSFFAERKDKIVNWMGIRPRRLALMTPWNGSISALQSWEYQHRVFGACKYCFENGFKVECTEPQLDLASRFTCTLFDHRWKQRTDHRTFGIGDEEAGPLMYRIVVLSKDGNEIDWSALSTVFMNENPQDRSGDDMKRMSLPAVWQPVYETPHTYIAHKISSHRCSASFPHKSGNVPIGTYADYFAIRHGKIVSPDARLYHATHMWSCPNELNGSTSVTSESDELEEVLLPQELCRETSLSDPGIVLEAMFLPQALYFLERHVTALNFLQHCETNLPEVSRCIGHFEHGSIDKVCEMLTASTCSLEENYEKLEWLGDAILKLVVTRNLLEAKSPDLRRWIRSSNEGMLTSIRSERVSNQNLELVCKNLGFDQFIMSKPFGRGSWWPSPLRLGSDDVNERFRVTPKQCSDVVEALLGLILSSDCSFEHDIVKVSFEMRLMISESAKAVEDENDNEEEHIDVPTSLVAAMKRVTGVENFADPSLIVEAFTHPTAHPSKTPSYQRLEWVGDAVLDCAVRCWIFENLDCSLGTMDHVAHAILSNESLAFVSLQTQAHCCISHNHKVVPHLFQSLASSVRHDGRGLWATEPPKLMADVIEATVGAVYQDQGFERGERAALHAVNPILQLLQQGHADSFRRHPKRALTNLFRKMVHLGCQQEDIYQKAAPGSKIWSNEAWREPCRSILDEVAWVDLGPERLIAVSDSSRRVATNHACALVLATLERHPELARRVQQVKKMLQSNEDSNSGW